MRFPATPGWGPPAAAVAVSLRLDGGWVGGFPCCVCLWHGARAWYLCWCVCCVFVVVVWVWEFLPCVLVCVCVCACVVCGGWFPRLGLAARVGVDVAGVCCGCSLATTGGGS